MLMENTRPKQSTIPSNMRALELDAYKGQLRLIEKPVPHPGLGEVLIQMAAAPISPGDFLFMRGEYGVKKPLPVVPGLEGSGTVVAAGSGLVPRWLMGKRVACASSKERDGTWAEYMVTSAMLCVPLLKSVSLEQGALMLVNPMSAWALMDIARRGKHKALANTASASALGRMILRLGQRFNYPVVHIVRRQAQVDLLRNMGAEYVLNSSDPDFDQQLRRTFRALDVTLALDAIAGEMTGHLLDALPRGGSVILYGGLSSTTVVTSGLPLVFDKKSICGFYLIDWLSSLNLMRLMTATFSIQRLLATDLQTSVRARIPLEQGITVLETYASEMTQGKFLIVPGNHITER